MDDDVLWLTARVAVQDLKLDPVSVRRDRIVLLAGQTGRVRTVVVQCPAHVLPALGDHRVGRVAVERTASGLVFLEGDGPGLLVRPGDHPDERLRPGGVRVVGKPGRSEAADQPYGDQRQGKCDRHEATMWRENARAS